jgi:hypothetical protein
MSTRFLVILLGLAALIACDGRRPATELPTPTASVREIDVSHLEPLSDSALRILIRGATIKGPQDPDYMTTSYSCRGGLLSNGQSAPIEGTYTIGDGLVCSPPDRCAQFYQVDGELYMSAGADQQAANRAFLVEVVQRERCD